MNSSFEKKEYLVQVTIMEARNINPPDESGMANPFVKMKVADLPIQTSEVNYETLTPVWNQSFTFSGLLLSMHELQSYELSFELWSKNNYVGNDLVGIYSVGLHTLYRNANHEFWNCWLTLTSPDAPLEAQGYLLVNCFIIGPGDKPPFHSINDNVNQDQEEESEEINVDAMSYEELKAYQEKKEGIQILGKPMVARKSFQLSVYVFKAEHLVDFPYGVGYAKCSAFVSARSVGLVSRTKMIKKNNGPVYNQKMLFPCYYPFLNDKILLRIWNYRSNAADDFVANIPEFPAPNDFFNITKLISLGGRMPAKWINLYGIPPWERNTAFTNIKHPKEGTAYLGRVLISFSLLANEKPTYTVMPCNPFYDPDSLPYYFYVDIYKLYFLKNYDIIVWCEVQIGNFTVRNKKVRVNPRKNTAEWSKEEGKNFIMLPGIVEHFNKDQTQIPDIFIHLYTGIDEKEHPTRIGYIRLKAEEILKWNPEPRWLHFKSLDQRDDSPGSILTTLNFNLHSENARRVFHEKSGMEKSYNLYSHIVCGFELDPKNSDVDDDYEIYVEVELDGEARTTKTRNGRYPFFNEKLINVKKLDMKLEFAPDVLVTVKRTNKKGIFGMKADDEVLGTFSVPIRCCREGFKYPHYFNLIRNNEKNGRLLANFFIEASNTGNKRMEQSKSYEEFIQAYDWLSSSVKTNVEVAILGLRDFNFTVNNKFIKLEIGVTGQPKQSPNLAKLGDIHSETENKKETFLNVMEIFKFNDVSINGNAEFMIFPILSMKLSFTNFFFIAEERFLINSLKEFYSSQVSSMDSNNKSKLYRQVWEQNLDVKTIDQELVDVNPDQLNKKKKKKGEDDEEEDEDELEEEEIMVKQDNDKNKDEKVDLLNKNVTELMLEEKKEKEKAKEGDKKPEQKKGLNIDKLLENIRKYKNMEISHSYTMICKKPDKDAERMAKKVLRKAMKKERKELSKIELVNEDDVAKLLKLEKKIRDLSRPLMNEGIFYGFDDLSDDYDYGREVYKEDVYETHSNMYFNYIREFLYYLPGIFSGEEKAEDMGGYMKYGRKCGNIIKYNVKINVVKPEEEKKEEEPEEEETTEDGVVKKIKKKERRPKLNIDSNKIAQEVKNELKTVDLFTPEYIELLRNCYLNKTKKAPKDSTPLQFNNIKVRVYIYRCLNLAAQDNCNEFVDYMAGYSAFCRANAFIELMLGDNYNSTETKQVKYINDVNNYQKDTLNPNFFKFYELEGDMPMDWKLVINVRSYSLGGVNHSLIGSTVIDLEDRYLCDHRNRELLKLKALERRYNNLKNEISKKEDDDEEDQENMEIYQKKIDRIDIIINHELKHLQIPVESRPLFNPDKKVAQGMVEMFVEVLTSGEAKMKKPEKIEPPPPEEFELRLIIWETREIPAMDVKKPKSIFIKVNFDPEGWLSNPTSKETDCHMGVDDGHAIYNWRMKFPLKIPCTFPRFYFTVNAFNIVGTNDTLGECYISLKRVFKRLLQEGKLEIIKKWIPFSHPKDPGEPKGELLISIYMVQQFEADQDPVGESWDEPNKNPKLDKPTVGRGVLDFLKGTIFDITKWDFNWDFFGWFRTMAIIAAVVIVFVVLFIAPGILVK